jgi:hypothetical protein
MNLKDTNLNRRNQFVVPCWTGGKQALYFHIQYKLMHFIEFSIRYKALYQFQIEFFIKRIRFLEQKYTKTRLFIRIMLDRATGKRTKILLCINFAYRLSRIFI